MRAVRTVLSVSVGLLFSGVTLSTVAAAEFGTADEARAMLERAVAAIQENKEQALSDFNAGAEGYREKDLYVFCVDEAGNFTAHGGDQDLLGESIVALQDHTGERFGGEIYGNAVEGEFVEVDYSWPRPDGSEPVEKATFVTKVDDQICAVGYYK